MIGTKCIDVADETRKEKSSRDDENRRITVLFLSRQGDRDRKPDVILTGSKLSAYGTDPELTSAYNRRVKLYKDLPVQEG